jgi:8-oxo-dGTP pyrophosphatase MutT (NUDIX family)
MEIKNQEMHRVAVTAIIYNDEGKYLIAKRSPDKKRFPNLWTVPGGGLETDDYINDKPSTKAGQWYYAIEKTLRREVREEVNLEIEKPEYLLDLTFISPNGQPCVVLSYYAKYKSGEVKLDADSVEYKWVSLSEAKNYDLIDGIWEEIEMVDKILKNGK